MPGPQRLALCLRHPGSDPGFPAVSRSQPRHPLWHLWASETSQYGRHPRPPWPLQGSGLEMVGSAPLGRFQPPALLRLLFLAALKDKHSWKPSPGTQSGCEKCFPLLGNDFQRSLQSRVSMGTRAGYTGNLGGAGVSFVASGRTLVRGAGPWCGGPHPATAVAFWPPALTHLKSSYRQICLPPSNILI